MQGKKMRLRFGKLIFVFLVLMAAACEATPTTPAPSASVTPQATRAPTTTPLPLTPTLVPARVLRIALPTYPDVLDPQRASQKNEIAVLRLVYEGLLSVDERGNVSAGAADKWESSKDGAHLLFHIRPGLKRFDGTPITAKDFEYALKRQVDPRVSGKPYSFLLFDIRGAEELDLLDPARVKTDDIEKTFGNYGVKAIDDATLSVTFKNPNGFWQSIASTWATFPTDKKQVDADPAYWWIKPAGHNGNGPFTIQSIETGKKIVLAANPNYWRGKPGLDRIELIYISDAQAALDAYKKGEVDIDANIKADALAQIDGDSTLKDELLRYPAAVTLGLGFNVARKPFDDRNVRMAFSAALDREGYVRDVLKGIGKPYTRWIPPGVPGAQADKPGAPGFDPKAAVRFLVDNGYAAKESTPDNPKVDCGKLGAITIAYPQSDNLSPRFQFIGTNLIDVFGCPLILEPMEPNAYAAALQDAKTQPQFARLVWIQDYPHPQNWMSYWSCAGFGRRFGYCNRDLDALLFKAEREPDPQKSLPIYQQAEDLLLKDVPAIFVSRHENLYLIKPYVTGIKDHTGSNDLQWAGEWGPVWTYGINPAQVPANYPKK
jgi:oligopeptide transport system substrate-binding protein